MASLEFDEAAGRAAVAAIVEEAAQIPDNKAKDKAKREELKLRKQRRDRYLEVATEALAKHGHNNLPEEGPDTEVVTDPIEVTRGGNTLKIRLRRHTVPYPEAADYGSERIITTIQGIEEDSQRIRSLYQVEQESYKYRGESGAVTIEKMPTNITNHLRSVATNYEVSRGLDAIRFIARELDRQHPQTTPLQPA